MTFRLTRRDVIRGAGAIAIGLPWLEVMGPTRSAKAQTVAQRFIAVYQPGGAEQARWLPTGPESGFTLSQILAPLESVRQKLLVLGGLDMKCAVGEQHQAGIVGLLTGRPQGAANLYPSGPSLDQVLTEIASAGKVRPSLEVAVRWATGKSHGLLHAMNAMTFANDGRASPISPRIDPQEIFDSLFGNLEEDPSGGADTERLRKQSILDFVDRRYETLSLRLGTRDQQKLDEHLTKLRELEASLQNTGNTSNTACVQPTRVDTSDYNPASGLNADNDGLVRDASSDAAIPKVGKFMMDMLVMAFTCDLTGVATLQWSDTEAKHTFPWLNLSEHHHFYQHDGNFRPDECALIGQWYSEQHAYLLSQMDAVDMGGHTLLDESVVFFGSEISHPPSHTKDSMPFLLAGGGGGLRGNRFLQFNGQSHNDLLTAILNLFGDTRTKFGDERYATAPLTGLV